MIKRVCLVLSICMLTCFMSSDSWAKKAPEDTGKIQDKLTSFANDFMVKANTHLRPSRHEPAIMERNGRFVAYYLELEQHTVTTELIPTKQSSFPYMAKMKYVEHTFECVSDSKESAKQGPYEKAGSRRVTELPRYMKGKWTN